MREGRIFIVRRKVAYLTSLKDSDHEKTEILTNF